MEVQIEPHFSHSSMELCAVSLPGKYANLTLMTASKNIVVVTRCGHVSKTRVAEGKVRMTLKVIQSSNNN